VTILFADVKGSMALSRLVELEDWWLVIAGVLEELCEGVSLFGGWVGGCTGDGIMAVFESRARTDDHAERACEAALWLRDAMRQRAEVLGGELGLGLAVRIGVNSGEVLTGTIGRRHGSYYTAAGYAVALAKRIEALATPGRVCISEHTARLVSRTAQLHDLGAFDVKGAPSKVRIFELT
jgi:class 3 adenylate cyclase